MTVTTELDLGPIRIKGARRIRDAGADRYVLELEIGSSYVEVIASAMGRAITIELDGERLVAEPSE
jgi:hypothetical protein